MTEQNPFESKQRIIQEFVPGKQVTMAHLIANPNEDLYKKLGVVSKTRGALGILTITPSEAAIIGADVATKAAEVEIVFVDRFSGSLHTTKNNNTLRVKKFRMLFPEILIIFNNP